MSPFRDSLPSFLSLGLSPVVVWFFLRALGIPPLVPFTGHLFLVPARSSFVVIILTLYLHIVDRASCSSFCLGMPKILCWPSSVGCGRSENCISPISLDFVVFRQKSLSSFFPPFWIRCSGLRTALIPFSVCTSRRFARDSSPGRLLFLVRRFQH